MRAAWLVLVAISWVPAAAVAFTDLPFALDRLTSWEQFDQMSFPGGGLVRTGRTLRFVIDNRTGRRSIRFANVGFSENGETPDYVKYHYDFSMKVFPGVTKDLEEFNLRSYFTLDEKDYFTGILHSYPDGATPLLAVQFYPQDLIREKLVVTALDEVLAAVSLPNAKLVFNATGSQQTTGTVTEELTERKVGVTSVGALYAASDYVGLNLGEAVGTLQIDPDPKTLTADDIAVFTLPPAWIPPVAAVILRDLPDTLSPIVLAAKERGTPMMFSKSLERMKLVPGQRIRLQVLEDTYIPEPAGDEPRDEVDAVALVWKPTGAEPARFRDLCAADARTCFARLPREYGLGATHRWHLTSAEIPKLLNDSRDFRAEKGRLILTDGLAVPVGAYQAVVRPNKALRAAIEDLVRADAAHRPEAAAKVRALFATAALPRALESRLPAGNVRVQLSLHPDDIGEWSGPGRPTSFDGEAATAVRAAYAALWSDVAIAERLARGIALTSVGAGLSIVTAPPAGPRVSLVTRVVNAKDVYGYSWQAEGRKDISGGGMDRPPAPQRKNEWGVAAFGRDTEPKSFTLVRAGSVSPLTPGLTPWGTGKVLVDIGKAVERLYCVGRAGYYGNAPAAACADAPSDNRKPNALRLEFVRTAGGQWVLDGFSEFRGK